MSMMEEAALFDRTSSSINPIKQREATAQ